METWNTYSENNKSISQEDKKDAERYKEQLSVSEKINQFVSNEGKGNVRDALNVLLARHEALRAQYVIAMSDLKLAREREEYWKDIAGEMKDNLSSVPFPS